MDKNSWQYKLFALASANSKLVKQLFSFTYLLVGLVWVYAFYIYFSQGVIDPIIYKIGVNFGKIALGLLGVVVLPGILGRIKIEIPITRIITTYRRQLGILVFLFAFAHFSIVRLLLYASKIMTFTLPRPNFEIAGSFALTIFFLMFLTSNNLSVKKLGKYWKKLHRFVYVAMWFLVLHTGLQRISIFSIFIFGFALLESISWIYYFAISKKLQNSNKN